ncbi:MAG: D-alanine-D-alanine ligase Ddl [Microgenomates group bacterium GW2011_GWC1_39_7b]|uniref:D-alanine--D-alanine ligase n=3 Tax=Candidatus Woeseibacteriota TaxID=1752722 RepID=A0A0G0PQW4_9BACT|nr:MAG: D-alanine-D-alanine ligase Ddl [Candidatus Woesebacteria bacterium GW2011_GWB1_39_10]KKR26870.1 MAG: D-alanine-D-alanine ligase Ddl [Microgenomates group bacterium GW2011_GWC1_39_7b]KKR74355.1 MAG: D-alanine-D-alanine ligase Ddl [Candidatus Woesebacteria bacterium GW2011_GWA2_40_7]KKS90738.1 MAG: D-alanine-D-alanine ligase Ddl [Candidatus Woesebacteria bacterium GW2011_GWA1_43_12]
MNNKIRVAVLMGGKSPEYDVSITSGNEVVKQLDKNKYNVIPFKVPKSGRGVESILKTKPDVVYIAMHGPFGEDGTLQGMLDILGIKYTGPGVLASAIGMDKVMFRKVMAAENISIPKYIIYKDGGSIPNIFSKLGKPPYFVKPFDQGSSVGASVVKDKKDFEKSLRFALKYSQIALVDEFVDGLELTCAVLGNENPIPLPIIEIKALKGNFFDYKSKYSDNGAQEIVPARISSELTKKVQDIAVKVYKAVGCRGVSRVDFILKDNRLPVVLEINTSPGLTPTSLLPKAAKVAGMSYSQLLDRIIGYATEKN